MTTKTPNKLIIILSSALALSVFASLFLLIRLKHQEVSLRLKQTEINQLTEQIASLREYRNQTLFSFPTPTLTPTPSLAKKEDFNQSYDLKPISSDQEDYREIIDLILSRLEKSAQVGNFYLNEELEKIIFASEKTNDKEQNCKPGNVCVSVPHTFGIWIFDLKTKDLTRLVGFPLDIYEWCSKEIVAWTKTDHIYFRCKAKNLKGEGEEILYRIGNHALERVEICYFADKEKICAQSCDTSKDCPSGYFCEITKHLCLKECTKDEDCLAIQGQCKAATTITKTGQLDAKLGCQKPE